MEGEQHNTYDIEFFGANTMMGSLYLGALKAAAIMAARVGDEEARERYLDLFAKGTVNLDRACWDGDYYIQVVDLEAHPRYQYGTGCLADQLLGQWFSHVVGLGHVLPADHVKSSLRSLFKHNFRTSFYDHANPQRIYALADDAGLLLCTWPKGGRPALPVVYGDEVWSGIEYQVAAHMIYEGLVDEGLSIVKGIRDRHDGIRRNPFNEFECGDHYARALASWSVLLALSGYRYSAPEGSLSFAPRMGGSKFECFFSTGTAWGTVRLANGKGAPTVKLSVIEGTLELRQLGAASPGGAVDEVMSAEGKLGRRKLAAEATVCEGRAMATFAEPVQIAAGETLKVTFK
jgi:non-lysosomal glucosylceramidase